MTADPARNGADSALPPTRPEATVLVTRGCLRLLRDMGLACLTEVRLKTGRRVDILAIDRKGIVSVVEVKSSVEDYAVDSKWTDYLDFCDKFYFAVPAGFPVEILPGEPGLILADAYGASIERPAADGTMNASRRKALTLRFARLAAERVARLDGTTSFP